MLLVANRYLGVLLDGRGRDNVQMKGALLDAVLHLGVRLAAAANEPGVVTVSSGVNAHLGAVARQTVEEDERTRPLRVLATLRM